MQRNMKHKKGFIEAYHDFRESVDLTTGGVMPELDDLICGLLMGMPYVPADEDSSEDAAITAIDQRVAILKAVFVEANAHETDDFLDQGLRRYDQAGNMAKILLEEAISVSELDRNKMKRVTTKA